MCKFVFKTVKYNENVQWKRDYRSHLFSISANNEQLPMGVKSVEHINQINQMYNIRKISEGSFDTED